MSLKDLTKLPKSELRAFVNSFDTVLSDCDGVLWLENQVIDGSPQVLNKLRELGKKVFFVTNNSKKVKEDFVHKAKDMGFICKEEEMISTSFLAARYLHEKGVKKVYVVGSKAIMQELEKVGISSIGIGPDVYMDNLKNVSNVHIDPEVGAVVVGFDEHISYMKILKAASYLSNPKCLYVATNTDESLPVAGGIVVPGTGTMVAAITTCSGRNPVIIGKPNPFIVETLMEQHNIDPSRTLMIGDRCNTDVLLGKNCGFQTLLVLTGVTNLETALEYKNSTDPDELDLVADTYLPKLGDLLPLLEELSLKF